MDGDRLCDNRSPLLVGKHNHKCHLPVFGTFNMGIDFPILFLLDTGLRNRMVEFQSGFIGALGLHPAKRAHSHISHHHIDRDDNGEKADQNSQNLLAG